MNLSGLQREKNNSNKWEWCEKNLWGGRRNRQNNVFRLTFTYLNIPQKRLLWVNTWNLWRNIYNCKTSADHSRHLTFSFKQGADFAVIQPASETQGQGSISVKVKYFLSFSGKSRWTFVQVVERGKSQTPQFKGKRRNGTVTGAKWNAQWKEWAEAVGKSDDEGARLIGFLPTLPASLHDKRCPWTPITWQQRKWTVTTSSPLLQNSRSLQGHSWTPVKI